MAIQVLDVALVTTHRTFEAVASELSPVRAKTYLGRTVWLGGLDHDLEKEVMVACEPRGHEFEPSRLYRPLYSFHRTVHTEAPFDSESWDPGSFLRRAILCSHLVRPTSAGLGYAARIVEGEPRKVVPTVVHPGTAWLLDMPPMEARTVQDWLTAEDAALTAKLVEASFRTTLPRRVGDALFFFEYTHYIPYTNVRWPVLVTAAEALLKVYGEMSGRRHAGSSKVFVKRMKMVADLVGYPTEEDELRGAYEERSQLVHTGKFEAVPLLNAPELDGRDPQGFTAERRHLYGLTEEILRRALSKCILDPEFAKKFEDDAAVMRSFPIG